MDDLTIAHRYISKAQSADKRGIEFTLSFNRYRQLLKTRRCFYTGVELVPGENFSLDRVDSAVGYTDSNTVACDRDFNHRKGGATLADMKHVYRALKRKRLL